MMIPMADLPTEGIVRVERVWGEIDEMGLSGWFARVRYEDGKAIAMAWEAAPQPIRDLASEPTD